MKLTLIEPSGPNIELRTYECAACNSGASFLMAIEAASAPPPAVHAPLRRDRASE
jgi:hypothetical protein